MNGMLLKLWFKAQNLREEHGQDMVEYALVVGIIALGATAAMGTVSTALASMFSTLSSAVAKGASKITVS